MFNRKLSRASLGLALSAALGAASLTVAQQPSASDYVRGASRFAAGDFAQATAAFDEAIAAKSDDPRVYYFRGLCAARQNDPASAAAFYATAARLELETSKGRLAGVDSALTSIQGAERAAIEAARAKARADWKAKEAARQQALYGETLDRQRARLATPPKTDVAAKGGKTAALSFPSVRPFSRPEIPAHQTPDPYDPTSDEFNYFREDLGKTSLSTKEMKRLADLASREVYEDPMDKPAADGSPFINIYDPSEVFVDKTPYVGDDDPDVLYEADEKNALNALATSCRLGATLISAQFGASDASRNGGSTPYGSSSSPSSDYPSSYGDPAGDPKAAAPVEPSKADDTKQIFPGDEKPVASPFGDKLQLDAENDFDLFQAGRDFKPTAPAPVDPYSSSGGPH
ncbi:MAG: tetratricopeptide repeat protein [Thermoguttaceae bacterium]|nr:tetratricopeptide repeat protein [Thermoguttaceae bacterium]